MTQTRFSKRLRPLAAAALCAVTVLGLTACIPQTAVQAPDGPPDPAAVIRRAPNKVAAGALFFAYFQQGKPYTRDADRRLGQRNDGFDCSGFVWSSYTHGGVWMVPGREIWTGSLVTEPRLRRITNLFDMRPGDLVFFGNVNSPDGHVAMYLDNGWIIDSSTGRGMVAVRRLSDIRSVPVHSVWRLNA